MSTPDPYWTHILNALLATADPPVNYALTEGDVEALAICYDWDGRWQDCGWGYKTLAEYIAAEPRWFLADISRYYGDDYYLDAREPDDDMDGDAASALASCGLGTDEDYGYYGDD